MTMKKILPVLILPIAAVSFGQPPLRFDKRFVESEDKWVAFEMDKDSSYAYGFIYIDPQAGLTLQSEGSFRISPTGEFISKKLDLNMKVRLQPNQVKVAFIPEDKLPELKVSAVPDWLGAYKKDTASVERLYNWGFMYNAWGLSSKALTYLERAYKIEPKFEGLEVELGYSYNALGRYVEAITVLKSALQTNPGSCYLFKELSYAQANLGTLNEAAETCKKGITACSSKSMKAEIAYNMAYQYYKINDQKGFNTWVKETKKWAEKGDAFTTNIIKMQQDLKNQGR
jgi:tetratricopeptide (TPR) repeat protein